MRYGCVEKEPIFTPEEWQVTEKDFHGNDQEKESIFSIANGYIGVRGSFEEGFYDGDGQKGFPAVLLNGIFEFSDITHYWRRPGFPGETQSIVRQINVINVKIYIDGEFAKMTLDGYSRVLDFKTGIMTRQYVYTTSTGKKATLIFERFASQSDKHLLVCRIRVTVDKSAEVKIVTETNKTLGYEGVKDEAEVNYSGFDFYSEKGIDCAEYETKRSKFHIVCAIKENINVLTEKKVTKSSIINEHLKILKDGETLEMERIIGFACSRDIENPKQFIQNKVLNESKKGFDTLCVESKTVIDNFWKYSDVVVDTDLIIQQGIRFSEFQVFQSVGRDGITNISANGLSGTAYSGQTFWDTEMYMMPMFTYGMQDISRQLLMYRYNILDKSREHAKEMRDQGALYSWNTINGAECGVIFEAATAQYHINPDIGYALKCYYDSSNDEEFMVNYGAEMLFEISKCMSHRGSFIPTRDNKFCINVICGPDEYNPVVDNNMYTNLLTKRMFAFALEIKDLLAKKYPEKLKRLQDKCGMDESEFARIKNACDNMYLPYSKELDMYMQDDNFIYKDPINLDDIDAKDLPLLHHWHPLNLWRFQLCKQADLVLLTFICSDFFTKDQIEKIFNYYEPKTVHDSSLSASIHSIVACAIGKGNDAYRYLKHGCRMDLDNINNNTSVGLHSACMGGARMLIVNGYAGLRVFDGKLHFNPTLYGKWSYYSFNINYKGTLLSVKVSKNGVEYKVLEGKDIAISNCGKDYTITKKALLIK